ncbi:MAG: hypothetical protein AAFQ43_13085 [Bacteroidota bacterium]
MAAVAFFAFLFAAAIGSLVAWNHFAGRTSPKSCGVIHGIPIVIGIAALIGAVFFTSGGMTGWWLVVAFGLVAAGGSYLISRQVRGETWPGVVVIAHGGFAVASIVALGIWMFG